MTVLQVIIPSSQGHSSLWHTPGDTLGGAGNQKHKLQVQTLSHKDLSFWVMKHSCISQEYNHPESRLYFKGSLEAEKLDDNVQIHWIQVEVMRSLSGTVLKGICQDYLSFLLFLCPECGQYGWRWIIHLRIYSDLGMEEIHNGAWVPNTVETSQPWIIFFLW